MRSWTLVFLLINVPACFSQSIPFQTLSTAGGGTSTSGTFKLSGAFGQPIISSSNASGVKLESGFMPSVLAFSNNLPPLILFDSISNKIKKASDKISVTITDIDGIDSAKFYYRPIAGKAFESADLNPAPNNSFEISINPTWIDVMGMEYYFTAKDKTKAAARSPEDSKKYYRSYSPADGVFVPGTVYKIGTKKDEYRIISIPFDFINAAIGTQFNELANDEGQHSTSNYRIATYAGNNEWLEYPKALNQFERGTGYWFLTTIQDRQISLENASTPKNYQGSLFTMRLKPDWNQIGNPYPVRISWNDVQIYNPDIKIKRLHVYKGKFENGDLLEPYEGGFVFLDETSEKDVSIPFQGQEPGGGRIKSNKFSDDISSEAWQLKLKLQTEDHINELAFIGMHPEALNGNDFFDDYHPPRFAGYTEINFSHPEHRIKNFARDIAERHDKYTWTFSIDASSDEPLILKWDNENLGNNEVELYLQDETNSQLVNMRQKNTFPVIKNASYKIHYGENILGDIMPLASAAGNPYPNPWTIGRSEDIHIPFALPGKNISHHVTLEIADISGRTIKQIMNTSMLSGFYEATWNGKDQNEETCLQGLYLLRLHIESNSGSRNFYHRIIIKQLL